MTTAMICDDCGDVIPFMRTSYRLETKANVMRGVWDTPERDFCSLGCLASWARQREREE